VSAYEAPAVPIAPADHEFVSGNLTEAEVFEKYGLHKEALQQLQQITARFPGHVVAQEKMVGFLRTQPDRGALRDGLVGLALAKRASGDVEAARRAAGEAAAIGGIELPKRLVMERLALLAPEDAKAAPAAAPVAPGAPAKTAAPGVPQNVPTPSKPAAPVAAQAKTPAPPPASAAVTRAEEEELEILFEDADDAGGTSAGAGTDVIEEIEFYLEQGMTQDALNRIAVARKAGLKDARLDALEAKAGAPSAAPADEFVPLDDEAAPDLDRLDEADLSSITAALEAEYGSQGVLDAGVAPSDAATDESVDDVFSTFKEHVKAAVEAGDFRTHYDLGIAYKGMGLIDDAIAEFRVATGTPELYRDSCSMIGLCLWERGEAEEAIRWYRAALDAPGSDEVPLSGLRYELAEMLEASGDVRGAYDLLATVLAEEPGYRDVDRRLATLRTRLGL
jgi:tetratricopeptide (TPR) repeat protein